MSNDGDGGHRMHKHEPAKERSPFAATQLQLTTKYDVYVTRKRPELVYVRRALKLLRMQDTPGVCIHGLGAAVNSAAVVALAVQQQWQAPLDLSVSTSTVGLNDEFVPLTADATNLPSVRRFNSAITIIIRPTQTIL